MIAPMWDDVSTVLLARPKHRPTYACHTCESSNFKSIGGNPFLCASVDTMC